MNGQVENQKTLGCAPDAKVPIGTEKEKNRDIVGERFGRLVVIKKNGRGKFKELRVLCKCDCGEVVDVSRSHLLCGDVLSCGCWRALFKRTHGMSKTRTYRSWEKMIRRCEKEADDRFSDYGGRGIIVSERWKKFENFLEDMGERPMGTSLDRINNHGNYEPKNCRWATRKEQSRNSRANKIITYNGQQKCIAAWAEELNINNSTLRKRLDRGWSVSRAFNTRV